MSGSAGEQARRQMLADMGITVWRLRTGRKTSAGGPKTSAEGPKTSAEGPKAPTGGPKPPAERPETSIPRPEPPRVPRPARAAARPAPAPEEAVREPVAPARSAAIPVQARWSARSLVLGDVMLLVDGHCSRRDLRLAGDVLAAASGEWRGKPRSRQFQWPPNVDGENLPAADDGRRAFNAFVDKDVADHRLRLILCTEALAARLTNAWPHCRRLEIPALDVLGREGEAKRTLWRALRDALR